MTVTRKQLETAVTFNTAEQAWARKTLNTFARVKGYNLKAFCDAEYALLAGLFGGKVKRGGEHAAKYIAASRVGEAHRINRKVRVAFWVWFASKPKTQLHFYPVN